MDGLIYHSANMLKCIENVISLISQINANNLLILTTLLETRYTWSENI